MAYDATIQSGSLSISLEGILQRGLNDPTQGDGSAETGKMSVSSNSVFSGPDVGTDVIADTANKVDTANYMDIIDITATGAGTLTISLTNMSCVTAATVTAVSQSSNLGADATEALKGPLGQTIANFTSLKGLVLKNTHATASVTLKASEANSEFISGATDAITVLPGGCFAISGNYYQSDEGGAQLNGISLATGSDGIVITWTGAGTATLGLIGSITTSAS